MYPYPYLYLVSYQLSKVVASGSLPQMNQTRTSEPKAGAGAIPVLTLSWRQKGWKVMKRRDDMRR